MNFPFIYLSRSCAWWVCWRRRYNRYHAPLVENERTKGMICVYRTLNRTTVATMGTIESGRAPAEAAAHGIQITKLKKNYSYCSRSTYSIPNTYISIIAYFYWLFRCCCCRCCCSVCLFYCFTHSTRCHCHTAHSTSCKYQTFRLRLCSVPHELIFHFIYSFQLGWSKHR